MSSLLAPDASDGGLNPLCEAFGRPAAKMPHHEARLFMMWHYDPTPPTMGLAPSAPARGSMRFLSLMARALLSLNSREQRLLIGISASEFEGFRNCFKNAALAKRVTSNEFVQSFLIYKFLEACQLILIGRIDRQVEFWLGFDTFPIGDLL